MNTIFIITCCYINLNGQEKGQSRTWGWFSKFDDAEQAVMRDACDMFEGGTFNTAVIEEAKEGAWSSIENEYWYGRTENGVVKIDKPECFRNVCNFGIG